MKKILLIVLLSLSLFLSACVDTSQPWKDDTGHWHTHQVCHEVISTTYIQIPTGVNTSLNLLKSAI
jgi:outer membrane biogenesis lipoprotein LolB